ncbi:OLC1v1036570C1 [Oldenlandia corymbosa var. corymbosa]|uniref:OLC1v1036570C1 n=1 Tax=Oldenlandia corymbosa var. corymbosa TaxID=529605 RepID=A0AAV1CWE9_OLDCO|nr:OLC1v1036570C1 [Oldenlandia corymbosa var. corymbosa]
MVIVSAEILVIFRIMKICQMISMALIGNLAMPMNEIKAQQCKNFPVSGGKPFLAISCINKVSMIGSMVVRSRHMFYSKMVDNNLRLMSQQLTQFLESVCIHIEQSQSSSAESQPTDRAIRASQRHPKSCNCHQECLASVVIGSGKQIILRSAISVDGAITTIAKAIAGSRSSLYISGSTSYCDASQSGDGFQGIRDNKIIGYQGQGHSTILKIDAKLYSFSRPTYPAQLFEFITSKTPSHELVWDVGTGNGQAATVLAKVYKNVIASDTSEKQLEFAPKLPNIRYQCTPPKLSMAELEQNIGSESSVDLITIAQALHWFDFPTFYQQAKWILKKPNGVIAAWCYTIPEINPTVDAVFQKFYNDSQPYWEPERKLVDNKYETIDFPFEAVEGLEHTGPFKFKTEERLMSLEDLFNYIRSWSSYQTAKQKGVELLNNDVVKEFSAAWNEDGESEKAVTSPVHLKIGKVGIQF